MGGKDGDTQFGPRLEAARSRAGLNKNQLARELGTSWQHVDNWEKGRVQPSLASVRRLADLLKVSADFLLGLTDEPVTRGASPLEVFLQEHAPADLTADEERWLRDAPLDPTRVSAESYAGLLRELRGARPKRPPRSGLRHKQVDREAIEDAVRDKGRAGQE